MAARGGLEAGAGRLSWCGCKARLVALIAPTGPPEGCRKSKEHVWAAGPKLKQPAAGPQRTACSTHAPLIFEVDK